MEILTSKECSLCQGAANLFDQIELVTVKRSIALRTVETRQLSVFICQECMERYKAKKYQDEQPKKCSVFLRPWAC
jgi:hypothetical protein